MQYVTCYSWWIVGVDIGREVVHCEKRAVLSLILSEVCGRSWEEVRIWHHDHQISTMF